MGEMNAVSYLDLIVLGIIIISLVIGFMRGFTQEILGIVGWVGAAFLAIYALPVFKSFARNFISNFLIADIITGVALFLVSLIIFTLICRTISTRVRSSGLGSIDRSLGLFFGGVRGYLFVSLLYLLATSLSKIDSWPESCQKARVLPMLAGGSNFINSLLPANFKTRKADKLVQDLRSSEEIMRSLSRLNPVQDGNDKEVKYSDSQKKKINQLFDK